MTRTSTRRISSTRQNNRREADLFAEFCSRNLSLCQYLSWYFSSSTRFEGVQTHRPKLFNSNWSSLKRVLYLILQLASEDGAESRSRINDWIAEQADSIIVKEMERTKCSFVASHDSTPKVPASDYIDARLDAIAKDNPFISGRIGNLLSQCGDPPPAEPINCDKDPTAPTDVEMEEATPENGSDPGQEQEPGHEKRRIEFLERSVMGQIAFACNRRNHAIQHRNGLMILACGANDRLTTFLYDCGLATSRWATLQAAASLTKANSTKLKEIGSNNYFHLTVDNIDVTHPVDNWQLDRRTELLHRTFGYGHIQNGDIVGAYNLRAYSAHQASLPRVNLPHLLPTPQSDSSSTTGIKAAHHPPVLVIDGQLDALSKGLVRDRLCPICVVHMHFRRLDTQQTGRKSNTCVLHSNRRSTGTYDRNEGGLVIGVVQLPVQLAVSPDLLRYDNRVLSLSIEIGSLMN